MKIQYNRNRYYDYYTGRWLTHDPAGYVDGMNLYEYAVSRPCLHTDPYGKWCIGAGLGAGATAMLSVVPGVGFAPGVSVSGSEVYYLCKAAKKWSCQICDTVQLTVIPGGFGVNISAGWGPVISFVLKGVVKSGPSVTLGVGIGAPLAPGALAPSLEATADWDYKNSQITFSFPRFNVGMVAYAAFRLSGVCTGCTPGCNPLDTTKRAIRIAKILICIGSLQSALSSSIASLSGQNIPEGYPWEIEFPAGPSFSVDCPPQR